MSYFFFENRPICQKFPTNLRKSYFDGVILLIMKEHNYFNIQRKFQVHSTICLIRSKQILQGGKQPPLPLTLKAYPTPSEGRGAKIYFSKMVGKGDLTITSGHLMANFKRFSGLENGMGWLAPLW